MFFGDSTGGNFSGDLATLAITLQFMVSLMVGWLWFGDPSGGGGVLTSPTFVKAIADQ